MKARSQRQGFTLIELLVVIAILGILVALLVPVIWGAVVRANEARVTSEINTMTQALASFRAKYGDFPPSRVMLVENGSYPAGLPSAGYYKTMTYSAPPPNIGGLATHDGAPDISYGAFVDRSIRHLRKLFPRVVVSKGGPGDKRYDFNGNSERDLLPIRLDGHECLVFFLGGIPNHSKNDLVARTPIYTLQGMGGFNNDPTNPFRPEFDSKEKKQYTNRTPPFFEFQSDRLVDDDLDGIPGYIDSLGTADQGRYFAYFSSYGGSGYDPNDVNFTPGVIGSSVPGRSFRVSFPTGNNALRYTESFLPNPYTNSEAVPIGGDATVGGPPATFINDQSYQIISAGRDRDYGPGGQYLPNGTGDRLPGDAVIDAGGRVSERDNLSNFQNGKLE